jgi:hypothetical protein
MHAEQNYPGKQSDAEAQLVDLPEGTPPSAIEQCGSWDQGYFRGQGFPSVASHRPLSPDVNRRHACNAEHRERPEQDGVREIAVRHDVSRGPKRRSE